MRKLAVAAVCAVALTVTAYAQKKPDFSGTWVPDTSATSGANAAPAGGAAGRPGGGGELVIKQTADTLIIERKGPSGVQTQNYKLNGVEQEVVSGQLKMKAKPRWEGDKIVIDITRPAQDGTMFTTTTTYSIDKDGLLWLETPTTMGVRKVAYKKKPAATPKVI